MPHMYLLQVKVKEGEPTQFRISVAERIPPLLHVQITSEEGFRSIGVWERLSTLMEHLEPMLQLEDSK